MKIFPLHSITTLNWKIINCSDSMSTYEQFPNQYTYDVTSKFSDLEDDDLNYKIAYFIY